MVSVIHRPGMTYLSHITVENGNLVMRRIQRWSTRVKLDDGDAGANY